MDKKELKEYYKIYNKYQQFKGKYESGYQEIDTLIMQFLGEKPREYTKQINQFRRKEEIINMALLNEINIIMLMNKSYDCSVMDEILCLLMDSQSLGFNLSKKQITQINKIQKKYIVNKLQKD